MTRTARTPPPDLVPDDDDATSGEHAVIRNLATLALLTVTILAGSLHDAVGSEPNRHGAVTATDIGVEASARILGNITHNSLVIAPGALLEGRRPWRPRPVSW